ncbi:chaplin [Streptomyces sp. NPDC054834]
MRRGVLATAAATGILSLSYSSALADTNAAGTAKDSFGVLAGNSLQVPVDMPVNVCGNTVHGIAALNPLFGGDCDNSPASKYSADGVHATQTASATPSPSDDCDTPTPSSSPTPPTRVVHKPRPTPPPTRSSYTPPPTRSSYTPPSEQTVADPPQLAETGSKTMLATSAASAALIAGGVMMYRRGRAAAQR